MKTIKKNSDTVNTKMKKKYGSTLKHCVINLYSVNPRLREISSS